MTQIFYFWSDFELNVFSSFAENCKQIPYTSLIAA